MKTNVHPGMRIDVILVCPRNQIGGERTRLPTVPELSSAAKMPLPAFTSAAAVCLSSSAYFSSAALPSDIVILSMGNAEKT